MQAQSDGGTAFLNEINIIKGRDSVCRQPSSTDPKSFQMHFFLDALGVKADIYPKYPDT